MKQVTSVERNDDVQDAKARNWKKDVGALTTELAILVAVLVVVAVALATRIDNSATAHTECIPETVGAGTGTC